MTFINISLLGKTKILSKTRHQISSTLVHIAPPTHPNLQLDPLVLPEDRLDLEVDADGADEGRGERVVGVAEEEGGLADGAVADDEELEHVVKVLVCRILLPGLSTPGHLKRFIRNCTKH